MKRLLITTAVSVAALHWCVTGINAAESDRSALQRALAQFDRDVGSSNLDGMMTLFADDAVIFGAGQAPITGKPTIRAWWKGILEQFDVKGVHEIGEVTSVGDVIVMQGQGRGTLTPKAGGTTVTIENWILQIYRRQPDGSLRFWRGAFGPAAPAARTIGTQ
jgi:ketosteroid isomerase-like protein